MVNSLTIFDEQERKYLHVYGMLELAIDDNFATFYQSIEAAYNEIRGTVKN